jgi:hypothetical protein
MGRTGDKVLFHQSFLSEPDMCHLSLGDLDAANGKVPTRRVGAGGYEQVQIGVCLSLGCKVTPP